MTVIDIPAPFIEVYSTPSVRMQWVGTAVSSVWQVGLAFGVPAVWDSVELIPIPMTAADLTRIGLSMMGGDTSHMVDE